MSFKVSTALSKQYDLQSLRQAIVVRIGGLVFQACLAIQRGHHWNSLSLFKLSDWVVVLVVRPYCILLHSCIDHPVAINIPLKPGNYPGTVQSQATENISAPDSSQTVDPLSGLSRCYEVDDPLGDDALDQGTINDLTRKKSIKGVK